MNKIKIIAEIANAHQGNPDLALELARKVAEHHVDAIKFQVYFAEEFLTTSHPRYEHFKNQAFTREQWFGIFSEVKKLGVEIYADIFGLDAYKVAVDNSLDGLKIHSSDLNNTKLLEALSTQKTKVFLACGGSTIMEIKYALEVLTRGNRLDEIVLLHGFQAYPTKIEESVLSRLKNLKELFGDTVSIGYSDHVSGEDKFATIIPIMAIPYEISYIEKHVTLDRATKGVDYYSSYEPYELGQFIQDVRLAEQAVGANPLRFSESEKHYRNTVKKSWTTTRHIRMGEKVSPEDIVMKRTPVFYAPPMYEEIVGNTLSKELQAEESISRAVLQNKVLAIVVARSDSSRLPGKAVKDINGIPSVAHLLERLKIAKERGYVDTIAFCTTILETDNQLVEIAKKYPVEIYRGAIEDVLSRMMLAVDDHQDHNIVLRITGDDILIDSGYLRKTVEYHLEKNAHYTDAKSLPSGTEVEVFDSYILKLIHELSKDSSGSEYLTNYITNNIDQFEIASLEVDSRHNKSYRLTLDTQEDYEVIKMLLEHMKRLGKEFDYTLDDIVDFFESNPEVLDINKPVNQKATPLTVNTEINWQHLTKAPLVTVYITNYNYGSYIKQAIDSVLKQRFRDFEVIIIDDGSTDNSKTIIEQYRNNPKITIVYQENKGLNVTNNIAIKLANGKYIMRLDADDYLNENALMILTQKLNSDESLALVFPDYYLVDQDGNIMAEEKRHDFEQVTMHDQPAHGACTMIRKDVLVELEGYSEEFTRQDGYEIWIKVIKNKKVANIDLPLFYYRQHDKSLTKDKEKLLNTRHEIIKKHTSDMDVAGKNHVAIVPIRDTDRNPLPLRNFGESTLIDVVLKMLEESENISQIIVSTPNEAIIAHLKEKEYDNVLLNLRPQELARINTRLEDTIQYVVEEYHLEATDTISVINYEYPLRKSFYVDKAINALYLFNADSVMSVVQENANFYLHEGNGLTPFSTNSVLRLEREFVYKETGGIHVVRTEYFLNQHRIISDKASHIIMDDKSSRAVISEEDFRYLEYLCSTGTGKCLR